MSWKTINTNPNYQINEDGEIFSLYTQRTIKTFPDKDGYIKAHLYNKEKNNYTNYFVHRLVLENFVCPAPCDRPEVHHKDGNRSNNNIENLEWVSRKENDSHVIHKVNDGSYEPIKVQQLDLNGKLIAEYESMSEASRKTGCHISKISLVCSGKRFTTGGFKWKKVEGSTTISSAKSHEMGDSLDKDEDIVQSLWKHKAVHKRTHIE